MRTTAVRRDPDEVVVHPLRQSFIDMRDGFAYLLRTRWLFATLVFSIILVFLIMGPIEVLLPFAVKDQTGGGAGAFALALARVRGRRRGRVAHGRLAAHPAPVPDAHDPRVGLRLRAARDHRAHVVAVGHGRRAVHRRRAVRRRAGRVGHAAAATGAAVDAGPRLEPRLLRVARAHADLDGGRRARSARPSGSRRRSSSPGLVPPFLALATLALARLGEDELAHPLDAHPDARSSPGPRPRRASSRRSTRCIRVLSGPTVTSPECDRAQRSRGRAFELDGWASTDGRAASLGGSEGGTRWSPFEMRSPGSASTTSRRHVSSTARSSGCRWATSRWPAPCS